MWSRARLNVHRKANQILLSCNYAKWLEETLAKGRQEGRQEGQVEVALRLLQRNMAVAEVAECTGLSIAEVKKLRP